MIARPSVLLALVVAVGLSACSDKGGNACRQTTGDWICVDNTTSVERNSR